MSERDPSLAGGNVALAEQALGLAGELDPSLLERYEVNRICELANTKALNVRDTMQRVATEQGFALSQDELHAWRPDEPTTLALNSELRNERQRIRIIKGIAAYNAGEAELRRGTKLREHQDNVLTKFEDFLLDAPCRAEEGGKAALVKLPTGTGKTGAFAKMAEAAKFEEDPNEPVRVLVLVPTQQLVDQTMGHGSGSEKRGFASFAPDLDVGAYYQDAKELGKEVVVMCNASFIALSKQGRLPHFDLVVVDEVHTAVGPTMRPHLERYCQDKAMLGLSATPRKAIPVFGEPISEMHLREAIEEFDLLAPVRAELIEVEPYIDEDELPADSTARRRAIELAYFKARLEKAIPNIVDAVSRGLGVVIRCPAGDDIRYAKRAAEALREQLVVIEGGKGVRYVKAIEVGGSKQSRGEGKDFKWYILQQFDEGTIDALAHVKQLRLGWDSKRAKVFHNLAPGTSEDDLVQDVGRVLRLLEVKDKHGRTIRVSAEVWDYVDKRLGDRQYTVLDALEARPGEIISYDARKPAKRQDGRESVIQEEPVEVTITDVTAKSVGQLSLGRTSIQLDEIDKSVAEPAAAEHEPDTIIATQEVESLPLPDGLTPEQAAQWFDVTPVTFRGMLERVGGEGLEMLTAEDMELILLDNERLDAPPLPAEGYVSITDAMELMDRTNEKPGVFVRKLASHGVRTHRFRTPEGFVRVFANSDLEALIWPQQDSPA